MPGRITWLDHDLAAQRRMRRILALFHERSTRDELGLGAIRDSIADHLFPGTSTIQTRLRYMLFVPWMYLDMERKRIGSTQIAQRVRKFEAQLAKALLAGEDTDGVFGKQAGAALRRWPSSVYWGGLGTWGIRLFGGSQYQYHAALHAIYARRKKRPPRTDDGDLLVEAYEATATWHPHIPHPPEDFPNQATLRLRREEAEFIRDRIVASCRESLLAELVVWPRPQELQLNVGFAWQLAVLPRLSERQQLLLRHARLFSELMCGAALLYNLMLVELLEDEEGVEGYRMQLQAWAMRLDVRGIADWEMSEFWHKARHPNHRIAVPAQRFVQQWRHIVLREEPTGVVQSRAARNLVRQREQALKGPRSRFVNRRLLDEWRLATFCR